MKNNKLINNGFCMKTEKKINLLFLASFLFLITGCQQYNNSIDIVGTLEWDRIELTNESNEAIVQLMAKEGDRLKKDDIILSFDNRRAQADLNNAVAIRDQLAARLNELTAGARKEDIEQARQSVLQAKSYLHLAEIELSRSKTLFRQKLSSQTELDRTTTEFEGRKAQLALEQSKLNELETGSRKEQIEQAEQALQAAEAQRQHRQINLQQLQIRAPAEGLLDSLPFKVGEQPQPGSVVAVMLAGEHPYARVYIPEQIRAQIHAGKAASIYVDGVKQVFKAQVRSVSYDPAFTPYYSLTEADRSRLGYLAKLDLLDNSARELPAGLPLKVVFELDSSNPGKQ